MDSFTINKYNAQQHENSSKNFLQIVTEITFYHAFHFKSFLEKEAKFYFKNDDRDRDIINPTRKRKNPV